MQYSDLPRVIAPSDWRNIAFTLIILRKREEKAHACDIAWLRQLSDMRRHKILRCKFLGLDMMLRLRGQPTVWAIRVIALPSAKEPRRSRLPLGLDTAFL